MSDNVTPDLQMEWIDWDDWLDFGSIDDEADGDCLWERRMADSLRNSHCKDGTALPLASDYLSIHDLASTALPDVQQSNSCEATDDDIDAESRVDQCSSRSPALMVSLERSSKHVRNENVTKTANGYFCSFKSCDYNKPFARRADLDRHINAKHAKTEVFVCPAKGCFRKQTRRSFTRVDKLKLHLQTMHDANATVECPVKRCAGLAIRLVELRVHFEIAHGQSDLLRSLPRWTCPLKPCSQRRQEWSLYDHIVQHHQSGDLEYLRVAEENVKAKCIVLTKAESTTNGLTRTGPSGSKDEVQDLQIACPVCSAPGGSFHDFEQHMVMVHFVDPSQQEHLRLWTSYCKYFSPDSRYDPRMLVWQVLNNQFDLRCPGCFSYSAGWQTKNTDTDHHIDMHRTNWDDLRPCRRQILELYPEFGTEDCWKPVWADLAI